MIIYAYDSLRSRQMKWWQCSLGSRMLTLQCLRSLQNRYSQNNFQQVYRQFQILSLYPVARWISSSYISHIKVVCNNFSCFLVNIFSINLCFTPVEFKDFVVSKWTKQIIYIAPDYFTFSLCNFCFVFRPCKDITFKLY